MFLPCDKCMLHGWFVMPGSHGYGIMRTIVWLIHVSAAEPNPIVRAIQREFAVFSPYGSTAVAWDSFRTAWPKGGH